MPVHPSQLPFSASFNSKQPSKHLTYERNLIAGLPTEDDLPSLRESRLQYQAHRNPASQHFRFIAPSTHLSRQQASTSSPDYSLIMLGRRT